MSFLSLLAVLAVPDPASLDVTGAAKALFDAVANKNWWLVSGLVVWLLVTLARKYAGSIPLLGKFFALKWAGPLTALLFSAAGGLLTALFAGESPSWKMLISLLLPALTAVFFQEFQQKAREAASGEAAGVRSAEDADAVLKGVK